MSDGAINFFNDSVDDVLLPDGIPEFGGGQFSNLRANLLQQNQSKLLGNCDIDRLGKIRTRRGTILLGDVPPDSALTPPTTKIIQGITSYQTPTDNYVVAAHNKKIWKWDDPGWSQIATGGVSDDDEVVIYREGRINAPAAPPIPAGYTAGTTELTVDEIGYVAGVVPATAGGKVVAAGEKLYFQNNLRTDWYEYTIASVNAGSPTTTITLEEPGLVFDVKDNWKFTVARPYRINNGAGYPAGHTGAIAIDGNAVGEVNINEWFVVKSENVKHKILTYVAGVPTTQISTYTVALQGNFVSAADDDPIIFAQGNDLLFISDGTGPIYAWNGKNIANLNHLNTVDYLTGSTFHQEQTAPPTDVTIMIWFQNRLIVSGIAAEPDAIYFSDFFDATSWDRYYQKVRIGGGESDPITGLFAWTDYNLLVFKKNSIYVINLDPSQSQFPDDPTLLVSSFAVKQLHKKIGCPAPNTAVQVGGGSTTPGSDVFFVDGDKKVHSIRRVMAAETQQEVGTAVSLPIQDVLDTIDLDHIDKACAWYHNEHYILAFPSTRGTDGGVRNNGVVTYNLLTQSWCGVWGWSPTCFSVRTDLGSYSKLVFGDYLGNVQQWMDDLSLDDETETSYQDRVDSAGNNGHDIHTQILTRAFTGGDAYSFKTGLNVEFEFDESVADGVLIQVVIDKAVDTRYGPLAEPFLSLSEPRLRLPFTIPAAPNAIRLPASPGLLRKAFDLQRYGTWRELQFFINTTAGKLAIRSIRLTFFMDSLRLQTIRNTGVLESPITLPIFP